MTIYTICINPESGKYIAIAASELLRTGTAYSRDGAIAILLEGNPGITVDSVVDVNE